MKATRAELATRLREEQTRYEALERCWTQAKEFAIKHAGDRDAAIRKIDLTRESYGARIEALHADLRVRTEERDAAMTEARKYAETRRLADDLQTELAAAKIALAEMTTEAGEWAKNARDAVFGAGVTRGQLESLAALTLKNGSAAVCLAEIIAKAKPCAP